MNPLDKFHPSWVLVQEELFTDPKLIELNQTVLPKENFFPKKEDIFNVFSMPLDEIKVVILGQDPYPNPGDAIGYSFAVNASSRVPASLRIIGQELVNEGFEPNRGAEWKTLKHWTEQGVFLLNTALTVRARKAGSHLKYWKDFTEKLVETIAKTNRNCVWMLWGKKAQAYKEIIRPAHILEAPHPAAEAYAGGSAGFYGCNHFNRANQILESLGKSKINW